MLCNNDSSLIFPETFSIVIADRYQNGGTIRKNKIFKFTSFNIVVVFS